mgnify:FL=1
MKKGEITTKDLKNNIDHLRVDIGDVLKAVNDFSTDVGKESSSIKGDVSGLRSDVNSLKGDFGQIKKTINTQMVTKDYLDDKLGQMEVGMNLKHTRTDKLVSVLKSKKALTIAESKQILAN